MDELTLLRRVRAEVDDPSEAALAEGRQALEQAWAADVASTRHAKTTKSPRRRTWRRAGWTAGGVALALGLAAVLVATNVIGLAGWRGGASPAAADALNSAASIAARSSDPVLRPGQYLEVETSAVYSTTTDAPHGGMTSYLTLEQDQLYIPADRSQDWVWIRPMSKPYKTFGSESKAAADKWYAEITKENGDYVEKLRAPRGDFYGVPSSESNAVLSTLPSDPRELLNYIYKHTVGQGSSPDHEAFVWLSDRLTTGAVPAAYRAEFYRAAAMIPHVVLTSHAANLDGRVGVSIGYDGGDGATRDEIIIDPATGAYIGERKVMLKAEDGLPAGEPMSSTAVRTTVVDAAPAGGTQNGYEDDHHCWKTGPGAFQCPNN